MAVGRPGPAVPWRARVADRRWELEAFGRCAGRTPGDRGAPTGPTSLAFAAWAGRAGVDGPAGVDRVLLRRYLAYLATRRYARATVARKAAALRAYFRWCHRRGLVGADPAARLSAPSAGGRLPKVLSHRELAGCSTPTGVRAGDGAGAPAVALRDDAVLELLYAAGLRVAELCGLDRGGRRPRGPDGHRDAARGTRSAGSRCTTAASTALGGWLAEGRPAMVGPDEPARGRLLEPAREPARAPRRPAHPRPPLAGAHPPPRPAPQLRHPPPRRRRRPAGGPGAAGPRQPADHPDVHPREQGAPASAVYGRTHPRA